VNPRVVVEISWRNNINHSSDNRSLTRRLDIERNKVAVIGRLLASGDFLHAIQSTAGLEPGDLEVVEAVVELDLLLLAISVLDLSGQLLAWGKVLQSQDRDLISWLDLKIKAISFNSMEFLIT
jgi:hypothetical protein